MGVSGMLLYTGTEFIQILEGEDKVIEDLLETIKHDPRHRDFRIIEKKKITIANMPNGLWGSNGLTEMIYAMYLD